MGVLKFHGASDGHPLFAIYDLTNTKKCILKVNFFTIDVCWEPAIAHILGKQKGIIGALIQYTHWANTMLRSKTKNYNLTTIVSMG